MSLMLDSLFLTVNAWMTSGSTIAFIGCFAWGMVSVMFSPCHLASIPLIVAYVAGQETAVEPKQAGLYAGAFTSGLFVTIALVGIICAWLGRMLGEVGLWWQVPVGAVLIWVALGMLGVQACTMSGSMLYRLNLHGLHGAFGLGLAYGILSGSCIFGFIAPILAVVTVQKEWATGSLMMILFALGHCLPIVIAGSSMAIMRKLTENHAWQDTGNWFRKGAGVVVGLMGLYFMARPFIDGSAV
jgi:cytochrome c-type biogenesis protein